MAYHSGAHRGGCPEGGLNQEGGKRERTHEQVPSLGDRGRTSKKCKGVSGCSQPVCGDIEAAGK